MFCLSLDLEVICGRYGLNPHCGPVDELDERSPSCAFIDVTRACNFHVENNHLLLGGASKANLPGFCDPLIFKKNRTSTLSVRYRYKENVYEICNWPDNMVLELPSRTATLIGEAEMIL
eukprot:TRINITY_DN9791_c0_g1_i1.p1 TRINITY_DN9791_c0_g1~~TRINITY_DN9791_c0_g1_i1.p1  ORF type:complete len:119 (+),score=27.20 TRINITY_DN9791_c0_g1_i1:62-418(+)